jgi:hypothetical protein
MDIALNSLYPVICSILLDNKVNIFVSSAGEVEEDGPDVGVGFGEVDCGSQSVSRRDGGDDSFGA